MATFTAMTVRFDTAALRERITAFDPDTYARARFVAFYSALVAVADDDLMRAILERAEQFDVARPQLYEVVLQSYLFLGFPRMLQAADRLNDVLPADNAESQFKQISPDESFDWFSRGERLCRKVYRDTYEPLKKRVESFAPEIFRWMIIEGYGKVLSRPELSNVDRELAIVGCLVADNRPTQLFSHMRGALNVGCDPVLLVNVVEDLGPAFGDGYSVAGNLLKRLEVT